MYLIPQPYKCPKCGHECFYSPHEPHPSPVLEVTQFIDPTCPECWQQFIKQHVPVMERVREEQKS